MNLARSCTTRELLRTWPGFPGCTRTPYQQQGKQRDHQIPVFSKIIRTLRNILSPPATFPLRHQGRAGSPLTPPSPSPPSQSTRLLYLEQQQNHDQVEFELSSSPTDMHLSLSYLPGAGWTIQPFASILRLDLPDPGTSMNTGEESQVLVSRWRPRPRCRVTW